MELSVHTVIMLFLAVYAYQGTCEVSPDFRLPVRTPVLSPPRVMGRENPVGKSGDRTGGWNSPLALPLKG